MVLLQIYRLSQSVSKMSGKLEGTNGLRKRTRRVAVTLNFPTAVEDPCVFRLYTHSQTHTNVCDLLLVYTSQNPLQLRSASPVRRNKQIHTSKYTPASGHMRQWVLGSEKKRTHIQT